MRYAIVDSGAVTNIIALHDENASDFPAAVRLGERPVSIGDTYSDGHFYRAGTAVLTPLESAQAELSAAESDMAALVEIIYNNDLEVIG
jgi:hypothetical protein